MSEEDKVLCSHCLDMRSYTVKSRLKIHHHPQTNDEILVDDWDAIFSFINDNTNKFINRRL